MLSTNPMDSLRRKPVAAPRPTFPDAFYADAVLSPTFGRAWQLLGESVIEALEAHVIVLAEARLMSREAAALALVVLDDVRRADLPAHPEHWLAAVEEHLSVRGAGNALLGRAREEFAATAVRMAERERLLVFAERNLELRLALARLARGHLTTLVIISSGGQTVQPTSLAHYLLAQLGPLERGSARIRDAYARVNQSPLGAVAGTGTALPLRRDRAAELLGFDRVVENTFDALAAGDIDRELLAIIELQAGELRRFVADLGYWARDDVGLLTPGDEFVHRNAGQPQRRDPAVLQHLVLAFAELAPGAAWVGGASGLLGDEPDHLAIGLRALAALAQAATAAQLLTRVVDSLVVERAASANRAQRGFPTASELADFFVIDHELPYERANALAELIVAEALTLNMGAMQLTSEFIDRVALRELGVELGIEQETLSRCLAPRRFIERRGDIGGPAPAAVGESLDREAMAVRRERGWLDERRERLSAAAAMRAERVAALATQ
jgi:argininosuccinate lyase